MRLAGRATLIATFLALSAAAAAGPLEDAIAAYRRGDYATASQLWRPLADQGVARAQYDLGFMYANGQGVAKDWAEAAKWYRYHVVRPSGRPKPIDSSAKACLIRRPRTFGRTDARQT